MEFRKALFNAASVLALTAATQSSANAALPDAAPQSNEVQYQQVDPLLRVMQATKGCKDIEVVLEAIGRLYCDVSSAEAEALRGLVPGLATMGFRPVELDQIKTTLKNIISTSTAISEDVREQVLVQLSLETGSFKLADGQPKKRQAEERRRRRDPHQVGSTPRDPASTGQVPVPAS